MNFDNQYFICSQIGFVGDSTTVFLNLHNDPSIKYEIQRSRMRTTREGMLLNWAWIYPRWYKEQYHDPNLHKQLGSPFVQAHFQSKEFDLFTKFPGSNTITLLASTEELAHVYHNFAYSKLLDKKLYSSWYEVQKKNYPLTDPKNQQLADAYFLQGMTPLQYRAIAFLDWQDELAENYTNPVMEWHRVPYHTWFMENRSTAIANNMSWYPSYDKKKQYKIYVDKLANPVTKQLDDDYYVSVCNTFGLVPNIELYHKFWNYWLSNQPDCSVRPTLDWTYIK
jgi:hypothetical protein